MYQDHNPVIYRQEEYQKVRSNFIYFIVDILLDCLAIQITKVIIGWILFSPQELG